MSTAAQSMVGEHGLVPRTEVDQIIGPLQERLASLRAKLNEPNHSKESILMITTDLQPLYKKLLLIDLDRGIQKQLENFLWNDCFKKPLSAMNKVDQGLFHMMIESGIGFYMGMIQEMRDYFEVKLGTQFEAQLLYCTTPKSKPPPSKQEPSKDSVYYIIQNSIIHVGDLLRYRSSFQDAQSMYEKATKVGPRNGHPWNQMGLVQLLISDSIESILLGVYCYARALCVANPFLPAQQNLDGLLQKARELEPGSSTDELILSFLRQVSSITSGSPSPTRFTLQPVVAQVQVAQATVGTPMENLTRDHLFVMIVISLWVWKVESDKMYLGAQKSNLPKALELVAAVINGMLSVKTIGSEEDEKFELVSYLNVMLHWIRLHPEVLVKAFKAELDTAAVCRVANKITALPRSYLATDQELASVVLPEERRLIGFLPVARAYGNLKTIIDGSNPRCNAIRATRFLGLMNLFTSPESRLIQLVGNEFKEIQVKLPPAILRPAPRQNVALQSLFNQMQKSTPSSSQSQVPPKTKSSTSASTSGTVADDGWKQSLSRESSGINPNRSEGDFQSTWPPPPLPQPQTAKAPEGFPSRWETELNIGANASSASSSGPPPPGFPQRPHSGLSMQAHVHHGGEHGHAGVFSADTSPVPSNAPTPLDGNFSLLFSSIWTPMGNEAKDSSLGRRGRDRPDPW